MKNQYYRLIKDGIEEGHGMIDPEKNEGFLQIGKQIYRIVEKQASEQWNTGHHEKLPPPGCNQPPLAASDQQEIPF